MSAEGYDDAYGEATGQYDENGGYYDEYGGYYDAQGGYYDANGQYYAPQSNAESYYDENGGYYDEYGGYHDGQGGYYDTEGNYYPPNATQVFHETVVTDQGEYDRDHNIGLDMYTPAEPETGPQIDYNEEMIYYRNTPLPKEDNGRVVFGTGKNRIPEGGSGLRSKNGPQVRVASSVLSFLNTSPDVIDPPSDPEKALKFVLLFFSPSFLHVFRCLCFAHPRRSAPVTKTTRPAIQVEKKNASNRGPSAAAAAGSGAANARGGGGGGSGSNRGPSTASQAGSRGGAAAGGGSNGAPKPAGSKVPPSQIANDMQRLSMRGGPPRGVVRGMVASHVPAAAAAPRGGQTQGQGQAQAQGQAKAPSQPARGGGGSSRGPSAAQQQQRQQDQQAEAQPPAVKVTQVTAKRLIVPPPGSVPLPGSTPKLPSSTPPQTRTASSNSSSSSSRRSVDPIIKLESAKEGFLKKKGFLSFSFFNSSTLFLLTHFDSKQAKTEQTGRNVGLFCLTQLSSITSPKRSVSLLFNPIV